MTVEAACFGFSTRGRATESLRRSSLESSGLETPETPSPELSKLESPGIQSSGLESARLESARLGSVGLQPLKLGRPPCPRCGSILLMAEESRFNMRGRIDHAWSCGDCGNAFVTSIRLLSR